MKLNPTQSTTAIEAIRKTVDKIEIQAAKINPNLNMSPAQINRSVEISKDPPVTVLKFTNEQTKQIELQIPSEVQLRIYKDTQRFLAEQQKKEEPIVTIRV